MHSHCTHEVVKLIQFCFLTLHYMQRKPVLQSVLYYITLPHQSHLTTHSLFSSHPLMPSEIVSFTVTFLLNLKHPRFLLFKKSEPQLVINLSKNFLFLHSYREDHFNIMSFPSLISSTLIIPQFT